MTHDAVALIPNGLCCLASTGCLLAMVGDA
jgi:hypothetical protein